MRTTLNIDDDVLLSVQERARREHRSAGNVLSDLARQSLTRQITAPGDEATVYGFRPLPARGAAVSNTLIDRLREEGPE